MAADVVEERGRLGIKAAIDGDPIDGPIKFDIREDEEQNVKLHKTVELLTVAGYFRARIKGLSAFDKVVGGMVWCISMCNVDVDVDLLYQENSTIGQKIALTERIVKVLPRLKCPHQIEPHQIQGLDCIHIFPVIQWLVKKALEAKEEHEEQIQALAAAQFDAQYSLPEEEIRSKAVAKSVAVQRGVRSSSGPKRMYKRVADDVIAEEERRVHSTLLEYGWRQRNLKSEKPEGGQEQQTKEHEPVADINLSSLLSGLSAVSEKEGKVSAAAIASLVDTPKIQAVSTRYSKQVREPVVSQVSLTTSARATSPTVTTAVEELEAELERTKAKLAQMLESERVVSAALEDERTRLDKVTGMDLEMDSEIHRMEEMEAKVEQETASKLRKLMEQHDQIKAQEQRFKERCRVEYAELQSEIERLESLDTSASSVDQNTRRGELNAEHSEATGRLQESRLSLAQVNRNVAALQRNIDQVPSQAELNQYQRRFLELYNQVASKHRETKQFYTLHNTLLDVKAYMKREIDLLDNIYDVHAMATQESYKASFVANLEQILDGVRQNLLKVERKQTEERLRRDLLREGLQEMLDKQRLYYKTVKDFQEECKRSEELHAKLKQVEANKQINYE